MDILDERVLRDDQARFELGSVVPDLLSEAPALQLGEQAELAELRQPHAREPSAQL